MLYILIHQLWFSTSCDWMLTLWNSMEKVCKKLIRSHYDSRAHLESPKIEINILLFSLQKWNKKGGSGQNGRFHFLSPIHNQPDEVSYTQTSFNLWITQAEANILTHCLDLNLHSMTVYKLIVQKNVHIYSHFVCQPQGCTAKTCPISQVT